MAKLKFVVSFLLEMPPTHLRMHDGYPLEGELLHRLWDWLTL
jgi:hypothetical protein